ncbi:hypothetical protein [Clostridium sp. HBUAS56017]|uniref:hypothetical protein n=1 Tax=Clostridium sp. HBUAS56017 TaxID=2571128 RepID=UPI0011782CEF|nr:hypothetical protein [Clostridium sp. HBUAS56017]
MIEKAIEKIKKEMEKNKNPYVQAIGNYLLKQIEINKDAAEKIVNGETIEKSLKEVEKVAKKKAVKNCAVLEDREVYKLVRKFYGFEAVQDKMLKVEAEEVKPVVKEPITQHKNFSVNLKDLLV